MLPNIGALSVLYVLIMTVKIWILSSHKCIFNQSWHLNWTFYKVVKKTQLIPPLLVFTLRPSSYAKNQLTPSHEHLTVVWKTARIHPLWKTDEYCSNKYSSCKRLGEKSCLLKSVFIEEPLIKCDDGMSCNEKWGREWNEGGGRDRCYCNASRSVTFVYSITTSEALVQVF